EKRGAGDARFWYERGAGYLTLRQWDKAAAAYTKAIALDPDDGWLRHERCYAYLCLGQFDKALADCTKGIELDPGNCDFWARRGDAYRGSGQRDKALADYMQAIALDPRNGWAWNSRGRLYADLREWDKAIADFNKAIEVGGTIFNWYDLALVHLARQGTDEYRKACEAMLKRAGANPEPNDAHWTAWTCVL